MKELIPTGDRNDFGSPFQDISMGLLMQPANQKTMISHSGPVGTGIDIYHGLSAWFVTKQNPLWSLKKVDEWINVSPTHQQYYALTMAQKQDLEGKIKAGLAQAAQAVADFELIDHDRRKLEEIVDYFNKTKKAEPFFPKDPKKLNAEDRKTLEDGERAEAALKAIYIDQVDVATGNTAIIQIVQRWPTLIVDFQRLGGKVWKREDISEELKISEAEATLLEVKQTLYLEWKDLFGNAAKERLERIQALVEGRRASIDTYRKWVRPFLVRHSMIKDIYEDPQKAGEGFRETLRDAFQTSGTATAKHKITLWAYRPLVLPEFGKVSQEKVEIKTKGYTKKFPFKTTPYDELAQAVLLGTDEKGTGKPFIIPGWSKDTIEKYNDDKGKLRKGLRSLYPWVTKSDIAQWVDEALKEIEGHSTLTYQLMTIDITRSVIRAPSGETEDLDVEVRHFFATANIMLIKLVELKAAEADFERNIDFLMGLYDKKSGKKVEDVLKDRYSALYPDDKKKGGPGKSEKKLFAWLEKVAPGAALERVGGGIRNAFSKIGINVAFIKGRGPYDPNFKDIMTAGYFRAMGSDFGGFVMAVREMMGG